MIGGHRDETDLVEDGAVEAFVGPGRAQDVPIGPRHIALNEAALKNGPIEGVLGAEDHLIIDGLDHVAGGEADMDPKREMHEDMGLDAMGEQQVVGVDKNDVMAARRRETVERRRRLPVIRGPSNDFHIWPRALDLAQNLAAFIGRGVVHDDAFDIRIGLPED